MPSWCSVWLMKGDQEGRSEDSQNPFLSFQWTGQTGEGQSKTFLSSKGFIRATNILMEYIKLLKQTSLLWGLWG